MKITILTLFPEYFTSILQESILKRAVAKGLVTFEVINIRDYAFDEHQTADDRPFGGGPGMVMKIEPIALALEAVAQKSKTKPHIILTSAKGRLFDQSLAKSYAMKDHLIIVCGHYQGVDERVTEHLIDEEVRIGDYVLTGGEPAAAVMTDAVTRLLPGVLGNVGSTNNESHEEVGVGQYPSYTRPEEFKGWKVPEVLLTGDHQKIADWRLTQKRKI